MEVVVELVQEKPYQTWPSKQLAPQTDPVVAESNMAIQTCFLMKGKGGKMRLTNVSRSQTLYQIAMLTCTLSAAEPARSRV